MATYQGSCLCEAVTFKATGTPKLSIICHCNACQKWQGGAFACNYMFDASGVEITSGKDLIAEYADDSPDSGHRLLRRFCKTCGSNLFVQRDGQEGEKLVALLSGTMDETARKDLVPRAEVFTKRRREWVDIHVDGIKRFESMP